MSTVSSELSIAQPEHPDDGITPLQIRFLASALNSVHDSSQFSIDETVDWLTTLSFFDQQALYLRYVSRRLPFFRGHHDNKRKFSYNRRLS